MVSARAVAPIANSGARETTVIELAMSDGKECMALIETYSAIRSSQSLRHIDFYHVLKGHKIKVEIPIKVFNKECAPGIKEGGLLNQTTRYVTVEIQPRDIPEDIRGRRCRAQTRRRDFVKDLALPEDCVLHTPADTLVLHIIQPRAAVETEEEGTRGRKYRS